MSAGNRARRREAGLLPEPGKCVARNRHGNPCRLAPVKGAAVCHKHGGSAPQVRRKAAERIANASDIAVLQILALMQAPDTPSAVKLAAAKDLLDRADVKGKTTVELEVKPWEEVLAGIVADVPDGTPMREFHHPEAENAPVLVDSERADDYLPDNSDYSRADAASPAASDDGPPAVEGAHRRANDVPARPQANGDDRPPPARFSPTPRTPRRGRPHR